MDFNEKLRERARKYRMRRQSRLHSSECWRLLCRSPIPLAWNAEKLCNILGETQTNYIHGNILSDLVRYHVQQYRIQTSDQKKSKFVLCLELIQDSIMERKAPYLLLNNILFSILHKVKSDQFTYQSDFKACFTPRTQISYDNLSTILT